jgi:hypothetical protein
MTDEEVVDGQLPDEDDFDGITERESPGTGEVMTPVQGDTLTVEEEPEDAPA